MLSKLNKSLTGARGILTIAATYAIMYVDMVMANLVGVTPEMLKGAAMMAIPPTIKLIRTDLIPRLQELIKPTGDK
jgi:hypothetical protein